MHKQILTLAFLSFFIVGCAQKETYTTTKSPLEASHMASYELSEMKRDYEKYLTERISDGFKSLYMPGSRNVLTNKVVAVTSLVSINDFSQTSNFGRLFADLMITDMERTGWDVLDVRGTTFKVEKKNGEFYLSREMIKELPENTILLVGTYSNYKNKLILNLRLLDPMYNKLLASTNLLLDDEESYSMANINQCKSLECKESKETKDSYLVSIIEDDCSSAKNCEE